MEKQTIMVIEDDAFVMDIYQTKLSIEGFDVVGAENGMEALKKLEGGDFMPDLILLDILMPYVNGLEVLERIKKDERLNKIPIILLTNLSQKEEIGRGIELGANDYLIKSHFTPSEVLEKIRVFLPKQEA
ncbi:MAG: response regulator [Parcubacteria group bacterium]|jgi:CheY-like chemotaxis protein